MPKQDPMLIEKVNKLTEEIIDFDTSTVLLRQFNEAYANEENYMVYLLKD